MFFGREKAFGEPNWVRRLGYSLLGELHIPGRLRIWHVIKEFRHLGLWSPSALTILDAGGGEGAFAYFLARRFPSWTVVVADNDAATLERGRAIKSALGLGNLEVRDVNLCLLREEIAYDVVLCTDVLEHIEQDDLVVKHLTHTLKPGGVIIITSPSVPQPKHLPLVAWRDRRIGLTQLDYGHVRPGYSPEDLRRIMQNAGLEVERIRWTFGHFGTLMFDLFFITGDNRPNAAVYMILFPFYIGLSLLDIALPICHGAGILGVGRKV